MPSIRKPFALSFIAAALFTVQAHASGLHTHQMGGFDRAAIAEAGLTRQALHAAVLGFVHPVSGQRLRFETAPPADMQALEALLANL